MNTIMNKLFFASLAVSFTVMAASSSYTPTPMLGLNGNSLTVKLASGTSPQVSADWWLLASTPWGHWYYYVYPNHWIDAGTDLSRIAPAYQGYLFALPPFEVVNLSNIPSGTYTFYFGIDTNMNGILDTKGQYLVYHSLLVQV